MLAATTVAPPPPPRPRVDVKVTKVGAGYVFRPGSNYRCSECWKFIRIKGRCAELGASDQVKPTGYCTMWAFGTPMPGLLPTGAYTKEEVGYGEDPNGTLCRRCEYFDGRSKCAKVNERSPGDTPGRIDPGACCANQEPRE